MEGESSRDLNYTRGVSESKKGGFEDVLQMFKALDPINRERLLLSVAREDPQLAARLQKSLFEFKDFLSLEQRDLQVLCGKLKDEDLALSLRGVLPELVEKFLEALPSRRKAEILESLATGSPQSVDRVVQAQEKVIELARTLGVIQDKS